MKLFTLMENKNILIQDVSKPKALDLFFVFDMYRRDIAPNPKDIADFFAPYFTKEATKQIPVERLTSARITAPR